MISKSQISFIKSLHQKKYRSENRLFIAEGRKLIVELLHSDFEIDCIVVSGPAADQFSNQYSKVLKNTEIIPASATDLERISTLHTSPEVLAVVKMKDSDEEAFFDTAYYRDELALVLDRVKDPGNLGTIIRVADWYGIRRIICSEDTVELYNPKVVQATMGSITRVDLFYTDLAGWLEKVKPVNRYGALLDGTNVYGQALERSGVLIMGSESQGISEELLGFVNKALTIPALGGAESLNVAVSTAILCSEFSRELFIK